jgi:hypothetical protein
VIRYHEDALMKLDRQERQYSYRERDHDRDRNRDFQRNNTRTAHVNLVGWSANLDPPKFPKDDRNVSKKATPESKGARPCRHCGSGKHWDNECKHSLKGNRAARTNLATSSSEDREAQDNYEDLYYGLDSGEESEIAEVPKQDFEEPLRSTESEDVDSGLTESNDSSRDSEDAASGNISDNGDDSTKTGSTACATNHAKPALIGGLDTD